jgi:long-chain acyl-CoA synthetase
LAEDAAASGPGEPAWWRTGDGLDRVLADLLWAEAKALRPGGPVPPLAAFTREARLGETGLGFDSLERLALAAACGEMLSLHLGGLDDRLVVDDRIDSWREAAAGALDRYAARVSFRTSGSTGRPRTFGHTLAALQEEVAFFAGLLGDRHRVIAAVPSHHIYGFLFTVLLPVRLGVPVLDSRQDWPGTVVAQLRPGDLVVGHPAFWAAVSRAAPHSWPTDIVGMTAGALCPVETVTAVTEAGVARLLHIYGASETGGLGWRDDPAQPYRLLPFWHMTETGGLRRGAAAEIVPPDLLRRHGPDLFSLAGRRDQAVQIGGVTVYPATVRAVLLAHPGVGEAAVRLMAPQEGERLKAYIVPADASTCHAALCADLAAYAAARLGAMAQPRAFTFGRSLPMTQNGKPADWAVPSPAPAA